MVGETLDDWEVAGGEGVMGGTSGLAAVSEASEAASRRSTYRGLALSGWPD